MYNLARITKKLYNTDTKLFTTNSLKSILEVKKDTSFYNLVDRLIKNNVLDRLERGKYVLKDNNVHEYHLANFLYQPSYVSFESALNFHGVLSQFPQQIYSATTKRPLEKKIDNKFFCYHQIVKNSFGGSMKKNNFIIAGPEKALADQIYLTSKGIKNIEIDELDLSKFDFKKFKNWIKVYPANRVFNQLTQKIVNA